MTSKNNEIILKDIVCNFFDCDVFLEMSFEEFSSKKIPPSQPVARPKLGTIGRCPTLHPEDSWSLERLQFTDKPKLYDNFSEKSNFLEKRRSVPGSSHSSTDSRVCPFKPDKPGESTNKGLPTV